MKAFISGIIGKTEGNISMNVKMSLLSCLIWNWQSTSELSTGREEDLEGRQYHFSENKKQNKTKQAYVVSLCPEMQRDAGVGSGTQHRQVAGKERGQPSVIEAGLRYRESSLQRQVPGRSWRRAVRGACCSPLPHGDLPRSRLQLLFEDNGEEIRSWKDQILEKGEFEREMSPWEKCVCSCIFFLGNDSFWVWVKKPKNPGEVLRQRASTKR